MEDLVKQYEQRTGIKVAYRPDRGGGGLGVVARRCGFGTVETFHRAFKRWHGTTPQAFRESHRPVAVSAPGRANRNHESRT